MSFTSRLGSLPGGGRRGVKKLLCLSLMKMEEFKRLRRLKLRVARPRVDRLLRKLTYI